MIKLYIMEYSKPSLIENNIKNLVNIKLKKVKNFKDKYINIFINIFLFLSFFLLLALLLLYKFKGKLKPEELEEKNKEKKLYLFNIMHKYAINKQKEQQNLITNLPLF